MKKFELCLSRGRVSECAGNDRHDEESLKAFSHLTHSLVLSPPASGSAENLELESNMKLQLDAPDTVCRQATSPQQSRHRQETNHRPTRWRQPTTSESNRSCTNCAEDPDRTLFFALRQCRSRSVCSGMTNSCHPRGGQREKPGPLVDSPVVLWGNKRKNQHDIDGTTTSQLKHLAPHPHQNTESKGQT